MYAGGGAHSLRQPCQALLTEVRDGRLDAVTSAEVVQEILHRFLAIGRPDEGAHLAAAALDLFAPVLTLSHSVMLLTCDLVVKYPALRARDLVHVATCTDAGITTIVTPDLHFDVVSGIRRVAPDDSGAIAALLP